MGWKYLVERAHYVGLLTTSALVLLGGATTTEAQQPALVPSCCVVNFDNDSVGNAEGDAARIELTVDGISLPAEIVTQGVADDEVQDFFVALINDRKGLQATAVGTTTILIIRQPIAPIDVCTIAEDDTHLSADAEVFANDSICVFDIDHPASSTLNDEPEAGEPESSGGKMGFQCGLTKVQGADIPANRSDSDVREILRLEAGGNRAIPVGRTAFVVKGLQFGFIEDTDTSLDLRAMAQAKEIPTLSYLGAFGFSLLLAILAVRELRRI